MLKALVLASVVVETNGRNISGQISSSCLRQVFNTQYRSIANMLPERRSRRIGARSSLIADKKFSTPRKPSTVTKAEIKRASAIFSEADEHYSSSELSRNSSEDCASEKFERRRRDPQLDTIRRKLIFSQQNRNTGKHSIDTDMNTLCKTFRARKLRAAEPRPVSVDQIVKPEAGDYAEQRDSKKGGSGVGISSGPSRSGKRQCRNSDGRSDRIKSELVEYSVKQEIQSEAEDVQQLRPRTRRRKQLESNVKTEHEELAELVGEKPHVRRGQQRRKLDENAAGAFTVEETETSSRQPTKELDKFASRTSTQLLLAGTSTTISSDTRKDLMLAKTSTAVSISASYTGPYPTYVRPFPEECEAARDLLSALHGRLPEYERHKMSCPRIEPSDFLEAADVRGDGDANCATEISASELAIVVQVETVKDEVAIPTGHPRGRTTVLDSVVGTILSQNTTDNNSRRAFASLKSKYPTWEEVLKADPKGVEDCIRCGGLAEIKAGRILGMLKTLAEERGKICMEYLRNMSNEEIKSELSRFKGVGPKTVACVLMFHLQRKEFPVDTHVFRISKALGWVPESADREKTYLHLNQRIPDHLKFDIHCLFVTHGKQCPNCTKRQTKKSKDVNCPLINWSSRVLKSRSNPSVLLLKNSENSQVASK
ncbi:hypothetical protein R1sor_016975 [Riccia sorocarpa]|uniref:HhH-GPD domain-containing protein n=1 Tax=Riccia sorocarpa TaxID=122646 RepID=A0ABD3I5I4_9MARC